MSEEKPEKQSRKLVQPTSDEELQDLKRNVPSDEGGIFSSFGEETSSVPQVLGGMLGFQNKDFYSVIERTNLPPEELQIINDMVRLAEHGIGSGGKAKKYMTLSKIVQDGKPTEEQVLLYNHMSLDRPIPYIGQQVVRYLRLRISVANEGGHGQSRQEVENILTQWVAKLEAREAELRRQTRTGGVAG